MPAFQISNGTIQDISFEQNSAFVTVTYMEHSNSRRNEQTIRLVIRPRTVILNPNGIPVPVNALQRGMVINAATSSAMTRSIPPQSVAYVIQIIRGQSRENIVVGRILDVDQQNQNFTTISDSNASTVIRFQVPENTRFFDRLGRQVGFGRLSPGMKVRVRHADFMTASIPPQTTAFEVQII